MILDQIFLVIQSILMMLIIFQTILAMSKNYLSDFKGILMILLNAQILAVFVFKLIERIQGDYPTFLDIYRDGLLVAASSIIYFLLYSFYKEKG